MLQTASFYSTKHIAEKMNSDPEIATESANVFSTNLALQRNVNLGVQESVRQKESESISSSININHLNSCFVVQQESIKTMHFGQQVSILPLKKDAVTETDLIGVKEAESQTTEIALTSAESSQNSNMSAEGHVLPVKSAEVSNAARIAKYDYGTQVTDYRQNEVIFSSFQTDLPLKNHTSAYEGRTEIKVDALVHSTEDVIEGHVRKNSVTQECAAVVDSCSCYPCVLPRSPHIRESASSLVTALSQKHFKQQLNIYTKTLHKEIQTSDETSRDVINLPLANGTTQHSSDVVDAFQVIDMPADVATVYGKEHCAIRDFQCQVLFLPRIKDFTQQVIIAKKCNDVSSSYQSEHQISKIFDLNDSASQTSNVDQAVSWIQVDAIPMNTVMKSVRDHVQQNTSKNKTTVQAETVRTDSKPVEPSKALLLQHSPKQPYEIPTQTKRMTVETVCNDSSYLMDDIDKAIGNKDVYQKHAICQTVCEYCNSSLNHGKHQQLLDCTLWTQISVVSQPEHADTNTETDKVKTVHCNSFYTTVDKVEKVIVNVTQRSSPQIMLDFNSEHLCPVEDTNVLDDIFQSSTTSLDISSSYLSKETVPTNECCEAVIQTVEDSSTLWTQISVVSQPEHADTNTETDKVKTVHCNSFYTTVDEVEKVIVNVTQRSSPQIMLDFNSEHLCPVEDTNVLDDIFQSSTTSLDISSSYLSKETVPTNECCEAVIQTVEDSSTLWTQISVVSQPEHADTNTETDKVKTVHCNSFYTTVDEVEKVIVNVTQRSSPQIMLDFNSEHLCPVEDTNVLDDIFQSSTTSLDISSSYLSKETVPTNECCEAVIQTVEDSSTLWTQISVVSQPEHADTNTETDKVKTVHCNSFYTTVDEVEKVIVNVTQRSSPQIMLDFNSEHLCPVEDTNVLDDIFQSSTTSLDISSSYLSKETVPTNECCEAVIQTVEDSSTLWTQISVVSQPEHADTNTETDKVKTVHCNSFYTTVDKVEKVIVNVTQRSSPQIMLDFNSEHLCPVEDTNVLDDIFQSSTTSLDISSSYLSKETVPTNECCEAVIQTVEDSSTLWTQISVVSQPEHADTNTETDKVKTVHCNSFYTTVDEVEKVIVNVTQRSSPQIMLDFNSEHLCPVEDTNVLDDIFQSSTTSLDISSSYLSKETVPTNECCEAVIQTVEDSSTLWTQISVLSNLISQNSHFETTKVETSFHTLSGGTVDNCSHQNFEDLRNDRQQQICLQTLCELIGKNLNDINNVQLMENAFQTPENLVNNSSLHMVAPIKQHIEIFSQTIEEPRNNQYKHEWTQISVIAALNEQEVQVSQTTQESDSNFEKYVPVTSVESIMKYKSSQTACRSAIENGGTNVASLYNVIDCNMSRQGSVFNSDHSIQVDDFGYLSMSDYCGGVSGCSTLDSGSDNVSIEMKASSSSIKDASDSFTTLTKTSSSHCVQQNCPKSTHVNLPFGGKDASLQCRCDIQCCNAETNTFEEEWEEKVFVLPTEHLFAEWPSNAYCQTQPMTKEHEIEFVSVVAQFSAEDSNNRFSQTDSTQQSIVVEQQTNDFSTDGLSDAHIDVNSRFAQCLPNYVADNSQSNALVHTSQFIQTIDACLSENINQCDDAKDSRFIQTANSYCDYVTLPMDNTENGNDDDSVVAVAAVMTKTKFTKSETESDTDRHSYIENYVNVSIQSQEIFDCFLWQSEDSTTVTIERGIYMTVAEHVANELIDAITQSQLEERSDESDLVTTNEQSVLQIECDVQHAITWANEATEHDIHQHSVSTRERLFATTQTHVSEHQMQYDSKEIDKILGDLDAIVEKVTFNDEFQMTCSMNQICMQVNEPDIRDKVCIDASFSALLSTNTNDDNVEPKISDEILHGFKEYLQYRRLQRQSSSFIDKSKANFSKLGRREKYDDELDEIAVNCNSTTTDLQIDCLEKKYNDERTVQVDSWVLDRATLELLQYQPKYTSPILADSWTAFINVSNEDDTESTASSIYSCYEPRYFVKRQEMYVTAARTEKQQSSGIISIEPERKDVAVQYGFVMLLDNCSKTQDNHKKEIIATEACFVADTPQLAYVAFQTNDIHKCDIVETAAMFQHDKILTTSVVSMEEKATQYNLIMLMKKTDMHGCQTETFTMNSSSQEETVCYDMQTQLDSPWENENFVVKAHEHVSTSEQATQYNFVMFLTSVQSTADSYRDAEIDHITSSDEEQSKLDEVDLVAKQTKLVHLQSSSQTKLTAISQTEAKTMDFMLQCHAADAPYLHETSTKCFSELVNIITQNDNIKEDVAIQCETFSEPILVDTYTECVIDASCLVDYRTAYTMSADIMIDDCTLHKPTSQDYALQISRPHCGICLDQTDDIIRPEPVDDCWQSKNPQVELTVQLEMDLLQIEQTNSCHVQTDDKGVISCVTQHAADLVNFNRDTIETEYPPQTSDFAFQSSLKQTQDSSSYKTSQCDNQQFAMQAWSFVSNAECIFNTTSAIIKESSSEYQDLDLAVVEDEIKKAKAHATEASVEKSLSICASNYKHENISCSDSNVQNCYHDCQQASNRSTCLCKENNSSFCHTEIIHKVDIRQQTVEFPYVDFITQSQMDLPQINQTSSCTVQTDSKDDVSNVMQCTADLVDSNSSQVITRNILYTQTVPTILDVITQTKSGSLTDISSFYMAEIEHPPQTSDFAFQSFPKQTRDAASQHLEDIECPPQTSDFAFQSFPKQTRDAASQHLEDIECPPQTSDFAFQSSLKQTRDAASQHLEDIECPPQTSDFAFQFFPKQTRDAASQHLEDIECPPQTSDFAFQSFPKQTRDAASQHLEDIECPPQTSDFAFQSSLKQTQDSSSYKTSQCDNQQFAMQAWSFVSNAECIFNTTSAIIKESNSEYQDLDLAVVEDEIKKAKAHATEASVEKSLSICASNYKHENISCSDSNVQNCYHDCQQASNYFVNQDFFQTQDISCDAIYHTDNHVYIVQRATDTSKTEMIHSKLQVNDLTEWWQQSDKKTQTSARIKDVSSKQEKLLIDGVVQTNVKTSNTEVSCNLEISKTMDSMGIQTAPLETTVRSCHYTVDLVQATTETEVRPKRNKHMQMSFRECNTISNQTSVSVRSYGVNTNGLHTDSKLCQTEMIYTMNNSQQTKKHRSKESASTYEANLIEGITAETQEISHGILSASQIYMKEEATIQTQTDEKNVISKAMQWNVELVDFYSKAKDAQQQINLVSVGTQSIPVPLTSSFSTYSSDYVSTTEAVVQTTKASTQESVRSSKSEWNTTYRDCRIQNGLILLQNSNLQACTKAMDDNIYCETEMHFHCGQTLPITEEDRTVKVKVFFSKDCP